MWRMQFANIASTRTTSKLAHEDSLTMTVTHQFWTNRGTSSQWDFRTYQRHTWSTCTGEWRKALRCFCRWTIRPPRRQENRRTGGQLSEWRCQSSSRGVWVRHWPGVPSACQSGDCRVSGYHKRRWYWRCSPDPIWLKHTTTTTQWLYSLMDHIVQNRAEGPGNQRHLQLCREWQITSWWCQPRRLVLEGALFAVTMGFSIS